MYLLLVLFVLILALFWVILFQRRKKKILEFLEKEGKITSGRAADLLEVSRMTAFRYLQELVHPVRSFR